MLRTNIYKTKVVDIMSQVIAEISQGVFKIKNSKFTHIKLWYDNVNR